MNVWWVIAVAAVAVAIVSIGGFFAVRKMIMSLTPLLVAVIANGWTQERANSLLKRAALLVVTLLLLSLLPWLVLFATTGGMADQYFRNMVDEWMTEGELFKYLAIDEDEYHSLPMHWRQALAEITFREDDEDEALRQFIARLDINDIKALELVAGQALSGVRIPAYLTVVLAIFDRDSGGT